MVFTCELAHVHTSAFFQLNSVERKHLYAHELVRSCYVQYACMKILIQNLIEIQAVIMQTSCQQVNVQIEYLFKCTKNNDYKFKVFLNFH